MEGYDYDAAAITVKIEDIVRGAANRNILRRLKENDPGLDKLRLIGKGDWRRDENDYCPEGADDTGWLGYYIGQNAKLKDMTLHSNSFENIT